MVLYAPQKTSNLIIESFTVKTDEDIELGEIVNVNAGIVAAVTAATGPYFVALAEHDYSEVSDHSVPCGVVGYFQVQAAVASAIEKGDYVELSTTAGAVTLSDSTAFTDIVGIAMEAAATTATYLTILMGSGP